MHTNKIVIAYRMYLAHPKSVKNGIVKSYNTEVELIEKLLVNNKYPRKLIRNINRKRRHKKTAVEKEREKPDALVVIPYVPDLTVRKSSD